MTNSGDKQDLSIMNVDRENNDLSGSARYFTNAENQQDKLDKLALEQAAIINNPLVGIIAALNRKIVWSNSAFDKMMGYDSEELKGRSTQQLYANEDDFLAIGETYANIGNGGVVKDELEFIQKNGQSIWADIRGAALETDVSDSLWIFVDVTERKLANDILSASEIKFRTLFDSSSDAILLLDSNGFMGCNLAALKLFGLKSEESLYQYHPIDLSPLQQACGSDSRQLAKHYIEQAIQNDKVMYEWLYQRVDTERTFEAEVLLTSMNLGGDLLLQTTIRDITDRKKAEEALSIAATAFETQDGVIVTDENNVILRVNQAFTNITGYSEEEVIGETPQILSSGRHDKSFYMKMWQSIVNTGSWEGEIWNRRKSGEIYPEHLTITSIKNPVDKITHFVATLVDITSSRADADKIERLAFYDPLTDLPNRRLMIDRLKQALVTSARTGKHGALLFLDLDRFKTINDTLGHDVGDMLLQKVAARIIDCVRKDDTVSRIGGDEFVVLLENLSVQRLEAASQAHDVAEIIISKLRMPYQLKTIEHYSSCSIGATLFLGNEQAGEDILKQSDIAMYQSKKAGRNTLNFFDPEMQEAISIRADLENQLRKAIEQQHFELYYQIQVSSNGQVSGAEVLIRWVHPERGVISPITFIPLAEETGLILPIGQWVLDAACAQIKQWEEANKLKEDFKLAVNVSAKQFHRDDFVERVLASLARYGIDAVRIKLELTESILLENANDTITKMDVLSKLGIQFSLDDFGTGYSSLQYLKKLPLNQIKIDQSFVRDIVLDKSDRVIVQTIISMAHSLGIDVIAEGVETEEQRKFLIDNGCSHFQGYLFSKPVPVGDFEALLKI